MTNNKQMIGKLVNHKGTWSITRLEENEWETYYPVHPDDVREINEWYKIFDNVEARIASNPEVEFELVRENVDTGALEAPYIKMTYAKLIRDNRNINK